MADILPGKILIADPFLKDPNFMRSVIFLCEHQPEGSFGFVLNRQYPHAIGELLSDLEGCDFPVYYGGPVQPDTLHFLHRCPALIHGGVNITDDIYWGGEFMEAVTLIKQNKLSLYSIRFYIGYSGWSEGQLDNEMEQKTWLVSEGTKQLVFHRNTDLIWKDALKQKGGEYEQLINYPIDPQLN
ncbi:MAG TPA: YqgE/AlgH family protein [Chitinophagaceae bacterium]|nr:YqgE/AlgH family protein [Chitinophagaceae bacterium]